MNNDGNMRKRNHAPIQTRPKLRCPVCQEFVVDTCFPVGSTFRNRDLASPQPGQLTDCSRCHAVLEYAIDWDKLVLRAAPKWRVRELTASEPARAPRLSELVEAARTSFRVPKNSGSGSNKVAALGLLHSDAT
jgi:hypothetical protein